MSGKTVFISYSHKDEAWKDKLLPHLKALEQAGVPMKLWEDRQIDLGAKWYPEIRDAMADAAIAVLLISADYLASDFCVKEEVPFLLERQEKHGMLLVPVLIRQCPWKAHRWLSARQMLPRDGKCVAIDFPGDKADALFSDVAERVYRHFSELAEKPQIAVAIPPAVLSLVRDEVAKMPLVRHPADVFETFPELPRRCTDLSHLPETGAVLFGREEELTLLDQTWAALGQAGASPTTRVLAFKAQGGVGKSALINRWLADMRRDNFRGATRVFGWSFYSQGVREQGAASADAFIAAALRFFGDEAMAGSPASGWDKGARLAHLVGAERALLVLDGMEPLQSSNRVERGKLLDPGLESLLRGLARQSGGLCIITTREPLAELGRRAGVVERDLDQITPQAARALFRASHIDGTDVELEQLAGRFGPHALAISLLAVYLHEQPGDGLEPAKALERMPGSEPIDRVLAGFEKMLAGSAELEALRLLGLFDRPADEGCLRALRVRPAIPGLTDLLAEMGDADWPRVLARLDKLRLIHVKHGDSGKRFVDAHPLIREHFAKQLREQSPDVWRAAHRRLYEHLCKSTPDKDEPKLDDIEPLYHAVAHGCRAGLQREALKDVLELRIWRSAETGGFYSTRKLGAWGSDLSAVACFFETFWDHLSPLLTEPDQASLLHEVALRLRAVGRLQEALEPLKTSFRAHFNRGDWQHSAEAARNLSELELTLGMLGPGNIGGVDVAGAMRDVKRSVDCADRSNDAFHRVACRSTHAGALHQAGRRTEAEARFCEAEELQANLSNRPLLHALAGFRYCDLLLAPAERLTWQLTLSLSRPTSALNSGVSNCHSTIERAKETLELSRNLGVGRLGIALNYLTLGRAAFYSWLLEDPNSRSRAPESDMDVAVSQLREAGQQHYVPLGLITRAWLRFLTGARTGSESAQEDLDEAWEIAARGPMRLFMVDILLHRARLFGRRNVEGGVRNEPYPWESPEADLAETEKLIDACGYHRRDEELADAKKALLGR